MKTKRFSNMIVTVSIVFGLILLIALSTTNNPNFSYTFAQKNNVTKIKDTFTLSGPISSLVYVPSNNAPDLKNANVTGQLDSMIKFVLSGNWSLSVKKGQITDFKTSFTKVLADGNKRHTHDLINFKQDNNTKAQLTADNNLSVKGLVDVKLNNNTPWNNTKVDINVEKGNTIAIKLDNKQTSNHFEDQPIYGIVTSMIDENGTKMK
jgi:hypothetical protein